MSPPDKERSPAVGCSDWLDGSCCHAVQRVHFFGSFSSTMILSLSVLPMFSPVCDLAGIHITSPRLASRTVGLCSRHDVTQLIFAQVKWSRRQGGRGEATSLRDGHETTALAPARSRTRPYSSFEPPAQH